MKQLIVKTSGCGEALLVLHGWGMNSGVWQTVRKALESRYRVSWVDLPGHGLNRDIKADSLDDIVRLLMPLLKEKTHLLGWSLGGLIAQAMLQSNAPGARGICSLTLVASTPRFSKRNDWPHAIPDSVLDQFAQNLAQDLTATIRRFIALQFMGVKHSKDLQRTLVASVLQNPPRYSALTLGLNLLKNCDFRKNKPTIPQHWILAGRDRLIPLEVKEDLRKLHPEDQISIIQDAGHAPFMTHPEEFMSLLNGFLTKSDTASC